MSGLRKVESGFLKYHDLLDRDLNGGLIKWRLTMSNRSKEIEKCPNVNCAAPVCPLDPMKEICIWFSHEDICRKNFPPQWVKNQKKIQKKDGNPDNYYTFRMLSQNCQIRKGIIGIIPEGIGYTSVKTREKIWLKGHPVKRILTEKEKEVLRERFKKNIRRK